MTKAKSTALIVLVSILLATGLYINFILQKDFLTKLGFEGLLAIICILFFDASKIISEIVFFNLKSISSKLIIGTFALLLAFLSVYTTFSERTWKSQVKSLEMEDYNHAILERNLQIENSKKRLKTQLKSLDEQIDTKRNLITKLKEDSNKNNDKWLLFQYNKEIFQYNKEIDKLNKDKSGLLSQIDTIDRTKVINPKKHYSLKDALKNGIGAVQGENLEIISNLVIAVVTDGIILFLCFSLSFLAGARVQVIKEESHSSSQPVTVPSNTDLDKPIHLEDFQLTHPVTVKNPPFKVANQETILFYEDSELSSAEIEVEQSGQ
ncbi:MAG: hypothetical protein IEMM0008_1120 [bacterium]|nr:MAG: hypothetical protein IEMM0008_1120 [bacterium]